MEENLPETNDESSGAESPERAIPYNTDELREIVREIVQDILQRGMVEFVPVAPSMATATRRWWQRFNVAPALASILLVLWLGITAYALLQDTSETIPDELLGVWTTATPEYGDRYFQIARTSLRFGLGEGREALYQILNVKEDASGPDRTYQIKYLGGENVYTLSFIYEPISPEPVIRFANQKLMEWRKRTP